MVTTFSGLRLTSLNWSMVPCGVDPLRSMRAACKFALVFWRWIKMFRMIDTGWWGQNFTLIICCQNTKMPVHIRSMYIIRSTTFDFVALIQRCRCHARTESTLLCWFAIVVYYYCWDLKLVVSCFSYILVAQAPRSLSPVKLCNNNYDVFPSFVECYDLPGIFFWVHPHEQNVRLCYYVFDFIWSC